MDNSRSQVSYTGAVSCTSTQQSKSKGRVSSSSSAKTLDEVGEVMPEMQLCDGKCGQMVLVSKMTKLSCAHIFCEGCVDEGRKDHAECAVSASRKRSRRTKPKHLKDRKVIFEYDSQRAALWIQPNMTYEQIIGLLIPIFSLPDDYKITLTYLAEESLTEKADLTSTHLKRRHTTGLLPTSGVVLVTATP
ncbi:hypothetical protein RB195_002471 [Necator americanus]|uniref:RING-type domain-containing protein n=1 Tax=Necator americanus TaxID=51031 RepID=A0ABR1DJ68_NECAM